LHVSSAFAGGLFAAAVLAAYIPFTHMSHFVGKYFTYHAVRWDDAPLLGNRRMATRLAEYLTYKPTWAAGHIKTDGAATWAEVASSNPAPEAKR
jgi:nitrate reductase gamma subunit